MSGYCVAVMIMSKLKLVMPLMLDETVMLSTAWTDAPTSAHSIVYNTPQNTSKLLIPTS